MLHEESLELFREIRDALGIITCLIHLGFIALLKADYEGAASLLREALRLAWEADYKPLVQTSLYGLACVAACLEEPLRAVRLWGAVEGMQEAYGVHLTPITRSITDYEGLLAAARSQLDQEAWLGAWEEGKGMLLERAIEYALLEEVEEWEPPKLVPEQEQPPATERADTLNRREREVAVLVARGLTNRQISTTLGISERTAGNHVARILSKLGLRSRAQIASWATERSLLTPGPD